MKIHLKVFRSNNKGSPYNDNIIEFLLVKVDLNDSEHEGLPIKKIHHIDYYHSSLCVQKGIVCKALHYQPNMSTSTSVIAITGVDNSNKFVFRST